jgi:hypothetical protein
MIPGADPKGKFPLVVSNFADLPLYDVTILISRRNGFPTGVTIPLGTLHPKQMFRRLNLDVPLDDYVIEIRTKAVPYGFFERLTLTETDGQFHQSYYVRRTGSDKRLMDVQ